MKDRILETLQTLRRYCLQKDCDISIFYHEEDSYLMRFANSAISLNTNEHLIRLEITATQGRKRASYELITDLSQLEAIKAGIDTAAEMVVHAQPLSYEPTIPAYAESFADESGYDAELAGLSNEARLDYFNQASAGLEGCDLKLSGIFSNGANTLAMINTRCEHSQYFKTSDAQVTAVLSHEKLKWEVISEQSAQKASDLDADGRRKDLAFLLERYQNDPAQSLPLGRYDIVFGPAAIATMLRFLNWIGFNGGMMKRGYSMFKAADVGTKVFSEKFDLSDNPTLPQTFPLRRDFMGIERRPYPLFDHGIFQGFIWSQDEADEFGEQATGHTVSHASLSLAGGEQSVPNLEALVAMPREKDLLYIPFLHYTNIVNPSKGVITGSSRFGALLLKQDGSVAVPYNVRLTQSLRDVFGDKVAWFSQETLAYNNSSSYGARNPMALHIPAFLRVNDLEISHANTSY